MADLLTHVLVAYAVLTLLGLRVEWLDRRWVAVGMCGAAIPDLKRIELLVDDELVRETLAVPFTWAPLGSLWGVLLIAGAVALLFGEHRRRAYAALVVGAVSHLALDGLRTFADGRADVWLYPLWWRPPTPDLYVTADWRVTALAVVVALVVSLAEADVRERIRDRLPARPRGRG